MQHGNHNSDASGQNQVPESNQTPPQTPRLEATSTSGGDTNRERDTTQQSVPMSRWTATFLLCGFYTILWGVFFGLLLNSVGKLPSPVLVFATSVGGIIVVIGGVWGLLFGQPGESERNWLRSNFRKLWQQAYRKFSAIAGPIAAIIILAIPYFLFGQVSGLSFSLHPTPTVNFTPIPTQTPTKWVPVLKQFAPNCNNPKGVEWYVYSGGTHYFCYNSGVVMQQISSTAYGEMDLTKVNGISYNQTNFRVQVQVAFQNPGDTTTWASLLVQTPAAVGVPGGYIFTLSPDGHWEIQYIVFYKSITIVAQNSVTIVPRQLVKMTVIVQSSELYAFVNDQQVTSNADDLGNVPSDVGLIIERQNAAPSSLVQFSNFELDRAG